MTPKIEKKFVKLEKKLSKNYPDVEITYVYDNNGNVHGLAFNEEDNSWISLEKMQPIDPSLELFDTNDEPFYIDGNDQQSNDGNENQPIVFEAENENNEIVSLVYDHATNKFYLEETGEEVDPSVYHDGSGAAINSAMFIDNNDANDKIAEQPMQSNNNLSNSQVNQMNYGPNQYDPNQMNYGPNQYDPNQMNYGPNQYDPNQMNYGPNQYDPNQMNYGPNQNDPNQMNYGLNQYDPNQMNYGPNQYDPNQMNYGPNQNDPNQMNYGLNQYDPNQMNYGPNQNDPNQYDPNQMNYGPNQNDPNQMNYGPNQMGNDQNIFNNNKNDDLNVTNTDNTKLDYSSSDNNLFSNNNSLDLPNSNENNEIDSVDLNKFDDNKRYSSSDNNAFDFNDSSRRMIEDYVSNLTRNIEEKADMSARKNADIERQINDVFMSMEDVKNQIANLKKDMQNKITETSMHMTKDLNTDISKFRNQFDQIRKELFTAKDQLRDIGKNIEITKNSQPTSMKEIAEFRNQFDQIRKELFTTKDQLRNINKNIEITRNSQPTSAKEIAEFKDKFEQIYKELFNTKDQIRDINKNLEESKLLQSKSFDNELNKYNDSNNYPYEEQITPTSTRMINGNSCYDQRMFVRPNGRDNNDYNFINSERQQRRMLDRSTNPYLYDQYAPYDLNSNLPAVAVPQNRLYNGPISPLSPIPFPTFAYYPLSYKIPLTKRLYNNYQYYPNNFRNNNAMSYNSNFNEQLLDPQYTSSLLPTSYYQGWRLNTNFSNRVLPTPYLYPYYSSLYGGYER